MSRKVADVMWEMLANAGVKRCYGIVGDALNPVIDALRRNGKIEFIHVRHGDAAIGAVARNHKCTVLTDDFDLYLRLSRDNVHVLNFARLRASAWGI